MAVQGSWYLRGAPRQAVHDPQSPAHDAERRSNRAAFRVRAPYVPPMPTVFLNGTFTSAAEARVSAFDAAFQHGVGLFETMLAVRPSGGSDDPDSIQPHVIHLHEHLARLANSARQLALTQTLRTAALAEAVERTAAAAAKDHPAAQRLRIRLTITGGDLNLLSRTPADENSPTLLIVAQPATEYPDEMFVRGVTLAIADWKANPLDAFQGHKAVNYWPRLRELQIAAGKRAAEALVFQVTNHLAGGCVSNAFLVKDGALITPIARGEEDEAALEHAAPPPEADQPGNRYDPPAKGAVLPSPVLPGVVRRWVLDWAMASGLEVRRRLVNINDVLNADEVFLTNSSWGVLPVAAVEARPIGAGRPGEVGEKLVAAWQELTQ